MDIVIRQSNLLKVSSETETTIHVEFYQLIEPKQNMATDTLGPIILIFLHQQPLV